VQDFQIVGAPDWIKSDRFDIVAKAATEIAPAGPFPTAGGATPPVFLMLRSLLAERFSLAVRRETREMPVYALVVARADRKLGPQMKPADTDCAAVMAAARQARRGGGPPPPPAAGEAMKCGMMIGPGRIMGGAVGLPQLAQMLSGRLGRVILDRTELSGNFDVTLEFMPDQMPQFAGGGPPPGAPAPPPIDPNAPSLMTALQEQLGLKLESTRGPVEVLVVDRVEQPTAD
jgi:uncharacterized protein (TIGR03435 family)